MKKLNKIVLSVGTAASVVAPIAAVVSCGSKPKKAAKSNVSGNINGNNDAGTNQNQNESTNTNTGASTNKNQDGNANPNGNTDATPNQNQDGNTDTSTNNNQNGNTGSTIENIKLSDVQQKAYDEIVEKIEELHILPGDITMTEFELHAKPAKALVSFLKKSPIKLLALINKKETPEEQILDSAKFLKNDITVEFIRETMHKLINSFDPSDSSTQSIINQVQLILEHLIPMPGIVKMGFEFVIKSMETKIHGLSNKESTSVKNEIINFFDAIDIETILDKIINADGKIIPKLTSGADSINGFIKTILGPIITIQSPDATKSGISKILSMLSVDNTIVASQGYKDALQEFKKKLPEFNSLSDVVKNTFGPILVPLFEDITNNGKTTTAGLSALDMNLIDSKIPEFALAIGDSLKSLLGFDIKGLANSMNGASMGYNLITGLTVSQKGPIGNIIKGIQQWLVPGLTDELLTKLDEAEIKVNAADAAASAKHGDPALAKAQEDAKKAQEALQEKQKTIVTDGMIEGVKKINAIIDWVVKTQNSLLNFVNNFIDGSADKRYVKIVHSADFYNNIKELIIDLLSVKLPKINSGLVLLIQQLIPSFKNGSSILGLLSGLIVTKLGTASGTTVATSVAPTTSSPNAIYTPTIL